MNDVRSTLDRALGTEPPLVHRLDDVVAAGRTVRRRRRAVRAVASVASVVTVVGVAGAVASSSRPADRVAPPAAASESASVSPSTPPSTDHLLTPRRRAIAAAIRAASPQGWTFDLGPDRWVDAPFLVDGVEATADDGAGPGRLMVFVSKTPQLLHPCRDPEFERGASCVERALADGSVLTLRGLVASRGRDGTRSSTVEVVLTHPDGSGVVAESGDFTIAWPIEQRYYGPGERPPGGQPSRNAPTYTVEQLADVVLAVDAAVS